MKQRKHQDNHNKADEKQATLKDLLSPDILNKLKEHAKLAKAEEEQRELEKRKQAEEARKAKQKELENDFEWLLNNSSDDWRKHKSND